MGFHFLGPRHYGHWKRQEILGASGVPLGCMRSVEGALARDLEQLLPTLMGARDYRGAAAILNVIYAHFMTDPASCVTTSLEILRRLPDTTPTLVEFYESLIDWQSAHISNDVIVRERFLLYVLQGDLHEAYAYYKEHMQLEVLQQDVHVVASFGMVCYWLLFREDQELRDEYITSSGCATNFSTDDGDVSSSAAAQFTQDASYPIQHGVGTATLYQEALVSFRRAMTLSPESNVFVEYYVQMLVMKNDIELAADYLEYFYHLYPTEPHACRMLFDFYTQFFPHSTACRVEICIRWNTLDPSTLVPLKALVQSHENDVVAMEVLAECLCHSLDHCGSAVYMQLHPDTALWLWQQLADLLGPVSLPGVSREVAACFEPRQWWQRVYFSFAGPTDELTQVQVLQCVVVARVWGLEALSSTIRLHELVDSPEGVVRAIAKRFHLDVLAPRSTPPKIPTTDPILRVWTTQLSWRPSLGQLRTPHVLKRPQVLTSFDVEDAVQVHEVALDAAPPCCRIQRPPNCEPSVIHSRHSTRQHPYLWLMSQRSGRTNPWHIQVASTSIHAVDPPREAGVMVDIADTPDFTAKDCFAAAMEDELLLSTKHESSIKPPHLWTSYLYKNLPTPPTLQQGSTIIRALRHKHPFQPQHRIPARFLHWIQHYMLRHGVRATPDKCRLYLEAQWRRQRGRCRGLPSSDAVALAIEYFKTNPAILPRRIRERFREFVLSHGKHISLVDLCREFYTQLEARKPSNLPFFSVLFATTKQWMMTGFNRGICAVTACYPPGELNCDDDDDVWNRALNEEPPVAESSFLLPANQRYLSSIEEWLRTESPVTNATLVYYMHMHFDATSPDFPSPPSVLSAMIDYVRVQLHAELADVPTLEDSIYYSLPKTIMHKPKYRKYLESCVVRHPNMPFEDIVRIMLDKAQLPPSKDNVPSMRELYRWWKATVNDLVCAGLGHGTRVPDCTLEEADVARVPPVLKDWLGDIETAKKKLPKMLNLPDDMEIFAI
ncbi:hypothetical protein H310_03508 [Aphanomyces invadans]|uniref:Uncharacterized protein n=1 Tax=Aphanomyces invadans TaxID=157072 RepID=A0A024UJ11_9STRA|nr:hypothetical protein H310_03508 [Aphanomyces invadans]ETW05847.1 hypothetical protein H310_03508 [Aphanomyces invadans]|eukprot:XP_008865624.1 hypothetical protein H310_03508 [Aphanomyces invadans]